MWTWLLMFFFISNVLHQLLVTRVTFPSVFFSFLMNSFLKLGGGTGKMGSDRHAAMRHLLAVRSTVRVSQKIPPWGLVAIFPKRLGIFQPNYTRLLCVHVYARLQTFMQLSTTLTKLCHIKRDHPVHIMCAKCPPSAETQTGIFWHFSQTVRNF